MPWEGNRHWGPAKSLEASGSETLEYTIPLQPSSPTPGGPLQPLRRPVCFCLPRLSSGDIVGFI
jgi:hypothetical protein